nr:XRE family transcriptional regulator [Mycolicibacterium komanii]CRL70335.1 helix-turn-helix domain-containing protein [Mycolicibacterium komanii]
MIENDEEVQTVSSAYGSVWDAIADTPAESENLKVRSALMSAIRDKIDEFGWSQTVAARNMRITQPRVSDLVNGKISRFSVDALINLGAIVGVHMYIDQNHDNEDEAVAL